MTLSQVCHGCGADIIISGGRDTASIPRQTHAHMGRRPRFARTAEGLSGPYQRRCNSKGLPVERITVEGTLVLPPTVAMMRTLHADAAITVSRINFGGLIWLSGGCG